MQNPKVSLIVPCYNIASVCDRFFESLLSQTYDNLEIVCVNDGSTDNTEEKLLFYKEKLENNRGFEVKYIYQENRGLGGAINTGLKAFTGDFLCWADPDDYYEDNSFELRVKYMLEHPDCAIVTSDAYARNGDKVDLVSEGFPKTNKKNQFELLLKTETIFCCGCHMIRTSAFDKVNPERDIYEYRRGQNWQMLMPIYYEYDRDFLSIPLYNYVIYNDSMSNINETYKQRRKRLEEHKNVIFNTIDRMLIDETEKNKLRKKVEMIFTRIFMNLAFYNYDLERYVSFLKKLLKSLKISIKDCVKLIILFLMVRRKK